MTNMRLWNLSKLSKNVTSCPWFLGTNLAPSTGNPMHFGSGPAFAAYSCSGQSGTSKLGVRRRDETQDFQNSWLEEGKAVVCGVSQVDTKYKRRSCQMEFEEGINTTQSSEEFGKLGKQSSFSGSMEVIEVSWQRWRSNTKAITPDYFWVLLLKSFASIRDWCLPPFPARVERGELKKCIRYERIHIGFAKSKGYQCFCKGAYRLYDMHSHQRPFSGMSS